MSEVTEKEKEGGTGKRRVGFLDLFCIFQVLALRGVFRFARSLYTPPMFLFL